MPSYPPGKHPQGFVKDVPEEPRKPKRRKRKRPISKKKVLKLVFWASLIIILYLYYAPLKNQLIAVLQLHPAVWSAYLAVSAEITAQTLTGLFLTSFFGALFFVGIPVELVFLYYLTLDFAVWRVFLYVMMGNMLGMVFNYALGYAVGPNILRKLMKENYEIWRKKLIKLGGVLLLLGNIIPFPIEVVSVFIGGVRYPFTRFLFYTFLGKLIKFGLLYFGYVYFSESLSFFWDDVLWPWLLHMFESYIAPVQGLLY